ncbi:Hypothetical protein GGE_1517 [Haemophilus haemolyticus M21639]|nr:Hypothetical protein GGE_1517 [Haemophilus haemolyticus M21639]
MKPTNAMAQLEQWKKNNEQRKINQFVNEMNQSNFGSVKNCESAKRFAKELISSQTLVNTGVVNENCERKLRNSEAICESSKAIKNTQGNARIEAKSKYQGKLWANPLAFQFTQLTRQFKLILDSNRKCLEVYPDDFHHKLKMRDEMMDLIDRLKAGGKLFNALAKSQGVTFCRDNQSTLKDFNQANGYLIHKFGKVVAQIERLNIEHIEGEKLQGVGNE